MDKGIETKANITEDTWELLVELVFELQARMSRLEDAVRTVQVENPQLPLR